MRLNEVTVSTDVLIRNTIGKMLTAKVMVSVLNRIYKANFELNDTTPYVRAFNQAMESVDPRDELNQAKQLWHKLYQELSHANKRTPPSE